MAMPDLLDQSAPSVEMVLTTWLSPLGKVGTRRKAGDPVPQRIVKRVAGADDPIVGVDEATVSVHTFAASDVAAIEESDKTHRRMCYLAVNPDTRITLAAGRVVNVDYCIPRLAPGELDYEDPSVVRYVARYEIGISYSPAQ